MRISGDSAEYGEAELSIRDIPGGWLLLHSRNCDEPHFFRAPGLQAASKGTQMIACSVEEHVMFCSAEAWQDGSRQWRVVHSSEEGPLHLAAEGALPSAFSGIRGKYEDLQSAEGDNAGVDYIFEIPLALAKDVVGFKHDEWSSVIDERPFSVLKKQRTWKFWKS